MSLEMQEAALAKKLISMYDRKMNLAKSRFYFLHLEAAIFGHDESESDDEL